ncbi:MAG: sugar O-acyltransferase (sialic acid O-acetyltransferase NeuD family) [Phycisphaerales bacterium]|jgi:sugar O-acyltransferase (sialic acid O-acetyltransferase NeuD family)
MGDSEPRSIILVGGGGHASVMAEAARRAGTSIVGFLDDQRTVLYDYHEWLGPIDQLGEALAANPEAVWALAIGDVSARRRILDRMIHVAAQIRSVVDPGAVLSANVDLGSGCFVGTNAVLQPRVTIKKYAIINSGAIVEHDCLVGENTHIAPGAVLGGNVKIGSDTLIGLGARVKPGVKIGSGVTVGVGAVVINDIDDGQTVVGVPARALGSAVQ